MSKFYQAVIKREQYFYCPVVVEDGISHEDAESALDDFWGLKDHVKNNCDRSEETTVQLIRLKSALTEVDDSDFQGSYSSQGLAVWKNKLRNSFNELATCATYAKTFHGHFIKDENTKTSA